LATFVALFKIATAIFTFFKIHMELSQTMINIFLFI